MDCSDKNRRSMSQALQTAEFGEEALTFVSGKTPRPRMEAVVGTPEKMPTEDPDRHRGPGTDTPAPPQHGVSSPKPPEAARSVAGIVSITVRLPANLPTRLLRASLERKLQRKEPFTQQDIVAAALQQWLMRNGEAE